MPHIGGRKVEHRYTVAERTQQLHALVFALDELIPVLRALPEFSDRVAEYQAARERAVELTQVGFDQGDLSSLSRAVPDLFYRHKDWAPPLVELADGRWSEPKWFIELERKLQPVLEAAQKLQTLGYY